MSELLETTFFLMGQFRPISLTPAVCQFLESTLKENLLSHLSQHGSLPHRFTVTNPITVSHWLDEGNTVEIVYLDFTKAFDSVKQSPQN